MRASSNNHYQRSLPFTDIQIHTNKFSEDDTGYDSLPKQERINSFPALSSSSLSSGSNNQCDRIMNLVKNIPSPTDISTTHNTSDIALTVAQRIAQFSKQTETPIRKFPRTRIQPIPDSTSDSAESFALSNHLVLVSSYPQQHIPSFSGRLEYIHDNRFDSTTTVDHIKDDIITIELKEQQQQQQQSNQILNNFSQKIKNFGESIRSLPANVLAIVFISLISGLILSAILIIIIL